jgi:hypothetical protein
VDTRKVREGAGVEGKYLALRSRGAGPLETFQRQIHKQAVAGVAATIGVNDGDQSLVSEVVRKAPRVVITLGSAMVFLGPPGCAS